MVAFASDGLFGSCFDHFSLRKSSPLVVLVAFACRSLLLCLQAFSLECVHEFSALLGLLLFHGGVSRYFLPRALPSSEFFLVLKRSQS